MRHRVKASLRVLASAIGVLFQVGVHEAHPQYSTYGSATAAALPDEPGDLAAYFECHGVTWSDDPNFHLGLTTWLHWGGEFLKVHTEWGLGSIATVVRGDITIGRDTGMNRTGNLGGRGN